MNLLGSLIPGVREVRAPLVSGYLWCVFLWLLLASHVPSEHSEAVYEHLGELVDAMGPIGKAVTVSIIAYLIGSLSQSAVELLRSRLRSGIFGAPEWVDPTEDEGAGLDRLDSLDDLQSFADPRGGVIWSPLAKAPERTYFLIQQAAVRELSGSFRKLQVAIEDAEGRRSPDVAYFMSNGVMMLRLRLRASTGSIAPAEFVVPRVTVGDLLQQRSLLETRLIDVAPRIGAQVERLQAEADFRLAIAIPLLFLAILFAVDASPFWVAGAAIPWVLWAQGKQLAQRATGQLFAAVHARAGTPDMERLTPIYAQYRESSSELTEAIGRAV